LSRWRGLTAWLAVGPPADEWVHEEDFNDYLSILASLKRTLHPNIWVTELRQQAEAQANDQSTSC
jgi:hypothetical protein